MEAKTCIFKANALETNQHCPWFFEAIPKKKKTIYLQNNENYWDRHSIYTSFLEEQAKSLAKARSIQSTNSTIKQVGHLYLFII